MVKYDLYKVLVNIFEQDENTSNQEELEDTNTIREFVQKYSIIRGINNVLISYGYSDLATSEKDLEHIDDEDIKNISGLEQEKESVEIKNSNVLSFLKYVKNRIQLKMKDDVLDQNNKKIEVPFIIMISWKYASIPYSIITNYFNGKLTITEYKIKNSDSQVGKINKFINSRKKYIKNSPFRLLGSIFVFNDWFYNWNIRQMEEDLINRKI
jgi:hypothetical protein